MHLREIGPRDIVEVPLDEIAALVSAIREERPSVSDDRLERLQLERYGYNRLGSNLRRCFAAAIAIERTAT